MLSCFASVLSDVAEPVDTADAPLWLADVAQAGSGLLLVLLAAAQRRTARSTHPLVGITTPKDFAKWETP